MKSRLLDTFAIVALLVLAFSASARAAEQVATESAVSGGNVVRATLTNGLRVVIVRDVLAPVVATQVTYLAGGYETPRGYPGTAHALEHMMFRGSRGLTGAQLNELSGKMGGDDNAFTTNDATQYSFLAPATYLDALLHIEASRMRGAVLSQKDWNLERGAIEQEVSRDISNPEFLAFEDAERILYAGTGYAEDPLGTRPSFDRTTAKALRAFYDDWYQPSNAILVIVGDVDLGTTLAKVKGLFDGIPSKPTPARMPLVAKPIKSQTLTRTTPRGEGSVQLAYRMPGMMANDYAAAEVLMDALDNSRSELSELAAQGKVLNAAAELQSFSRAGIGMIRVGFPKGGDGTKARADLEGVVNSLLRNGVPADLVEAAKRSELAQFEFRKNSPVSLASEWSEALAWQGLDSPDQAEKAIEKVSVADVNRVAHEYLQPDAPVTIVLLPDPKGTRPPNSSGFGGTESFTGNDKLDVPLPEWARKALGKLELPHWTLEPTPLKLANGVTLIVQPEHVSGTVTVVGHIDRDAGLQEPRGQEGVGRLLAALFDYGTTTLDRTEFHKALDAIAATASGGADFELAVPSADFDRGMQLLADDELHPALPEQAFAVQRQTLARVLDGERQTPRYKVFRALRRGLLPAGDPDLREATPESVTTLSLENVKTFFQSTYRPDLTTMVVVGDVTPDQAKATVEKYFGAWEAHGPKPDVVPPKVPVNQRSSAFVPNGYAAQDRVVMAQMLDVDLHNPDRYALQLGNDVLGGNGFASRLMLEIRVKHGYAYGAGTGLQLDRSRSIFYLQYGSDPDKMARVDTLALDAIKSMRQKPIADSELNNARQYEIRSIPLDVSSVERIARSLLTWSYKGEQLDQPMVAAKHYRALTPAGVRDVFERYLHPDRFVKVVEGPPPH